jgi:hypothetical protein
MKSKLPSPAELKHFEAKLLPPEMGAKKNELLPG